MTSDEACSLIYQLGKINLEIGASRFRTKAPQPVDPVEHITKLVDDEEVIIKRLLTALLGRAPTVEDIHNATAI